MCLLCDESELFGLAVCRVTVISSQQEGKRIAGGEEQTALDVVVKRTAKK